LLSVNNTISLHEYEYTQDSTIRMGSTINQRIKLNKKV